MLLNLENEEDVMKSLMKDDSGRDYYCLRESEYHD